MNYDHHFTASNNRRQFLAKAGLGFGSLALTDLLQQEGVVRADESDNPLAERSSHYKPKAKAIIWLFQTGSPSQVDTFDYKPELGKRDGQALAGADPKTGFFTTSGKCLKSPFKFSQHGESGAWISEIFPNISKHADDIAFVYSCHSQSNNHTPAMLELNGGMIRQGFPSMGSWMSYGLGSSNSNLPSYVVMHGTKPRGGDPIWSSGFLPSVYQATSLDPRAAKPIDNLEQLKELEGVPQRSLLDTLNNANRQHADQRPFDRDLNAGLPCRTREGVGVAGVAHDRTGSACARVEELLAPVDRRGRAQRPGEHPGHRRALGEFSDEEVVAALVAQAGRKGAERDPGKGRELWERLRSERRHGVGHCRSLRVHAGDREAGGFGQTEGEVGTLHRLPRRPLDEVVERGDHDQPAGALVDPDGDVATVRAERGLGGR